MLDQLDTEKSNSASAGIDMLDTAGMLRLMNQEDKKVAAAVEKAIPQIAQAVDAIVRVLHRGGRLFYIGAGTSGRLGVLDASECTPTFGIPPEMVQGIIAGGSAALATAAEGSEDCAEAGPRDLEARNFTAADALAGLTASGRTPYVLAAIEFARSLGAVTIGVTANPEGAISRLVQYPIVAEVGPEIIAGSTRLKAGTAQKLILNMLSTAAMVRLGYVYRNLMVSVQVTNQKLRERGLRIISQITGCDARQAASALEGSGNDVRTAIVMVKRGVAAAQARKLLEDAGNRISSVLEAS